MKHDFIDKYSGLESPIHSINPQVKALFVLVALFSISLTPIDNSLFYLALGLFFLVLLILSRIPPLFIFSRSLVILPIIFVISLSLFFTQGIGSLNTGSRLVSTPPPLSLILSVFLKSWLSILYLSLLVSSTRFSDLLKSLEKLGLPSILLNVLSFLYRYLFLFVDQGEKMVRAFHSRGKPGKASFNLKTLGNLIGALFLRSYERSERVYQAMLARGYQGASLPSANLPPVKILEAAFLIFALGYIFLPLFSR